MLKVTLGLFALISLFCGKNIVLHLLVANGKICPNKTMVGQSVSHWVRKLIICLG